MSNVVVKSFDSCDEKRNPTKRVLMKVCDLGNGVKAAKLIAQPGWKWSEDIKPLVGTNTCQKRHIGTVLSGQMMVRMENGTEMIAKAGDVYHVGPGHDGWVVGDEPMIALEFDNDTATTFAKN